MPRTPTPDDTLDTIMEGLDNAYTRKHRPFTDSQQRKAVDLRRAMRTVRRLQQEIDAELSTSVKTDIVTYFERSRDA